MIVFIVCSAVINSKLESRSDNTKVLAIPFLSYQIKKGIALKYKIWYDL